MLRLSLTFSELPILSLRTGSEVAILRRPIINPDNLKIEGFYVDDIYDKKRTLILLVQDIREILANGLAINDHEVLASPHELHRHQKILENNISLLNKPVVTASNKKIGKLSEYAVDDNSFYIQKLYVSQSLLRNITGSNLILDRNQIVDVSNSKIVVKDLEALVSAGAPQPA
ncbi:MAG: hypothetical protein WCG30_01420 [Candidatus Saccharibacteria bacterium]